MGTLRHLHKRAEDAGTSTTTTVASPTTTSEGGPGGAIKGAIENIYSKCKLQRPP